MNRLPAGVGQGLSVLKSSMPLPASFKTEGMPALVKNIFLGQATFFGAYCMMSGPNKMKLKRYFTVSPDSGLQTLATFHMCHTSALPLLINLGMMGSLGAHLCRTRGASAFTQLLAVGAVGATLAVAVDARSNPDQVQAGSLGLSATMLTYAALRSPSYFAMWRFSPVTWVAASLAYGLFYDDKAVVGGIAAGYAAFLMAL